MDQRTDSWHAWRMQGIGSSDAPVIMGVSPYRTPFQLWEEKTGKVSPQAVPNWAQRHGIELEPEARAHYELLANLVMDPCLVQHKDFPFLRASLDGMNDEIRGGLEIKCCAQADFELAAQEGKPVRERIPEKVWPQLQHQLMVSGLEWIHYFPYWKGKGIIVEVRPDPRYVEELFDCEMQFWKHVQEDTPPPLSKRDFVVVKDDVELSQVCNLFLSKKSECERVTAELAALRKQILDKVPHQRALAFGVQVIRMMRKGNVDYAKIPVLKEVDLEQYRKPAAEVADVRPVKGEK